MSNISGIQQIGIGVTDATQAKYLYKELFGMDVLVFDDSAEAVLMKQYTGGNVHSRQAILSMNLAGGGGFEIWQFTSRMPKSSNTIHFGDTGIFAAKIKTRDVKACHKHFANLPDVIISPLYASPVQQLHFWLTDAYGNTFNIVEGNDWFSSPKKICGGVNGAVIGVRNMDEALQFYKQVLGITEELYNVSELATDLPFKSQLGQRFKRVLLHKPPACKGALSKLLGSVQIELVEPLDFAPAKIFDDRYWGDCGFIHLCFDVLDMDALKQSSEAAGFKFSVDSAQSFAMDTASGRFCYVEDPDGTLIELVETHKVPILKKLNLHLNLKNRKHNKPLPDWMVGLLALNKVK